MRAILTLSFVLMAAATAASAKDYKYAPPASPAASQALQTPAQPQAPAQLDRFADANSPAIDTTPGQIRQATRIAATQDHDGQHPGFACVDAKCRTRSPVYNTRTTIQQEQGRFQP